MGNTGLSGVDITGNVEASDLLVTKGGLDRENVMTKITNSITVRTDLPSKVVLSEKHQRLVTFHDKGIPDESEFKIWDLSAKGKQTEPVHYLVGVDGIAENDEDSFLGFYLKTKISLFFFTEKTVNEFKSAYEDNDALILEGEKSSIGQIQSISKISNSDLIACVSCESSSVSTPALSLISIEKKSVVKKIKFPNWLRFGFRSRCHIVKSKVFQDCLYFNYTDANERKGDTEYIGLIDYQKNEVILSGLCTEGSEIETFITFLNPNNEEIVVLGDASIGSNLFFYNTRQIMISSKLKKKLDRSKEYHTGHMCFERTSRTGLHVFQFGMVNVIAGFFDEASKNMFQVCLLPDTRREMNEEKIIMFGNSKKNNGILEFGDIGRSGGLVHSKKGKVDGEEEDAEKLVGFHSFDEVDDEEGKDRKERLLMVYQEEKSGGSVKFDLVTFDYVNEFF